MLIPLPREEGHTSRGTAQARRRLGEPLRRRGHRRGWPPVAGQAVVVASGLSPSGPIHLGNLREVMVPHLVADEIRRRGVECVHILSWDDFDRLRKVPADVDPSWAEHVGKPLTSVPAPPGQRVPELGRAFQGADGGRAGSARR